MSKTLNPQIPNHRHLLCGDRKHCQVPVLHLAIRLLSHGNAMLTVAFRRTYSTIATTRLQRVKSTSISSVGWRREVWRCTMTTCWRKKTPLFVSQASKTVMASRSWYLPSQMIRLSGSGNNTLSSLWDGITITNGLSNTGVDTSSKAWDGWCGSQPTPSIWFTPLSIALTAIRHRNASILNGKLRAGGGRHR